MLLSKKAPKKSSTYDYVCAHIVIVIVNRQQPDNDHQSTNQYYSKHENQNISHVNSFHFLFHFHFHFRINADSLFHGLS